MPVHAELTEGVGIVTFSNPPLNPFSATAGIPQGVRAAIDGLLAQGAKALVLRAEGRMFSAGADIAEFDKDPSLVGPPIRDLTAHLDALPVPIVAAIQGAALGGGLEIALCCDYRIATAEAKFGLPEVTLALIPGAGGTQRLPRLVGGARAARMIATAETIAAPEALAAGLVDQLAEGDLRQAALAFAKALTAGRRRARDLAAPLDAEFDASLAALRAKLPRDGRAEAVLAALEAVEIGLQSGFDAGLAAEYRLFDELLVAPAAQGLRHAFLSERAVARIPGLDPGLKAEPIASVAVIGAGTMGTGISLAVVQAGLSAVLIDASPEAVERARKRTAETIRRNAEKGRISATEAEAQIARLSFSTAFEALSGADLVIEAVFEELSVKEQVFARIDALARPGAILASNTSTLDLDRIAGFTKRPGAVVGLHFFSPANLMKLLEVVRGPRTSDQTLVTAMGFARQIRKVGVVAGNCDGFIGNRMFEEFLRQAYLLLEEGALPAEVDAAMEAWGMAMGPFRTMDLAGGDIGWNIRKRRAVEQPDRPYSRIPDIISERGWYGQKTGRGYHLYPEPGAKPVVDPEVTEIVLEESARLGLTRRAIPPAEIVERCVLALILEGARILEEGYAARPLDIDTIWMNGYGFPRFRGGPMFHADQLGLAKVTTRAADFAKGHEGWSWAPARLLERLVAEGGRLSDLNGAKS